MWNGLDLVLRRLGCHAGGVSAALLGALVFCAAWMSVAEPARAGVYYPCPTGLHRFFACVQPDKPPPVQCPLQAGDPVDILTGRLSEEVVDWTSGGSDPLELKRSYTSKPLTLDASPYSSLGRGWRTNFDARLRMNGQTAALADWVYIILPDSFEYDFNKQNGVWQFMAMEWTGTAWPGTLKATPRTDLDVALTVENQQFVLRTANGTKYVFDTAEHSPDPQWRSDGFRTQLVSEIRFRGGYVQSIEYDGDNLGRVSDNVGRWIDMRSSRVSSRSTLLSEATTSDGTRIKYAYQDRLPGLTSASAVDFMALSSVTYPDATPATDADNPKVAYEYRDEAGTPGLLLSGMVDERGVRFATWTYDARGRVLSSEHAGGQDRTLFAYDDSNNVVTVTNPLGRATRYSYRMKAGYVRQLVSVDGIATPGCAASNTRYDYDASGFRSRATDAEGRVTTWMRNERGLPLSVTEASGTPEARTTAITWHAAQPWPLSVTNAGVATSYAYSPSGQVTRRTDRDAVKGQVRSELFTYQTFPPPVLPDPPGSALPDVSLPVVPSMNGQATTQDIVIPANLIGEVDSGLRSVRMSWRQWSGDWAAAELYFVNASGKETDAVMSPWLNLSTMQQRTSAGPVPPGTRIIRVKFQAWHSPINADRVALMLVGDGSAAANPFLLVKNSMALAGMSGWAVARGSASGGPSCGINPCFWNNNSAEATVYQDIAIPPERGVEIDTGYRNLALGWVDANLGGNSYVRVEVTFFDAAGSALEKQPRRSLYFLAREWGARSFVVSGVPAKTRRLRIAFSALQPDGSGFRAGWQGLTVKLVWPSKIPVPLGQLSAVDGPLPGPADTVRYGYDVAGNLASVTNELGQVTTITALDAGGRPLKVTDPNGVVTAMTYDPRGRLTTVTVNPGSAQARTTIAYDLAGQVTRVTSPDGSFLQYAWSDARRLTAVSNNAGDRIEYGYNLNGDVTSRTVKSSTGAIVRQQSALFDELGRLMRSIGAGGQQTLFRYDRTDNLTQVQDPRGGLFGYAYDGLQRLAAVTDQAGGRVQLTRDAQVGVAAYRDPRGITTSYVRNGFGEVIQESGPDVGTTTILRDERGLPVRITDPRGVVTVLSYDAAGRLVKEAHPADAAEDVTYSYDDITNGNKGVGRLTGITDQSGSLSRIYDALGRVTAETRVIAGKSYVITYGYNAAGRLTAIGYPSGRVVGYGRDGVGRINAVTTRAAATADPFTVASGFGWSPMSTRLTRLTHGNGLAASWAYDGDGRVTALKLVNGATRLMDLGYAYGDGMNLTAVNDNLAAANSVTLAYDAAQRLAYARGAWGSLTYGYTPSGDRAQEVLTPPGGGAALTTLLQYPASSNRLAATMVGSLTTRAFAYDAAGNLVGKVTGPLRLAFACNQRNRPVSLTRTGDGTQVSAYVYSALEQMVSRSTNAPGGPAGTVHYIYGLDGSVLAEADAATGATLRDYIWLPQDDASPAADNDNEEGASPQPLPLALVTGVNAATPGLLMASPTT